MAISLSGSHASDTSALGNARLLLFGVGLEVDLRLVVGAFRFGVAMEMAAAIAFASGSTARDDVTQRSDSGLVLEVATLARIVWQATRSFALRIDGGPSFAVRGYEAKAGDQALLSLRDVSLPLRVAFELSI